MLAQYAALNHSLASCLVPRPGTRFPATPSQLFGPVGPPGFDQQPVPRFPRPSFPRSEPQLQSSPVLSPSNVPRPNWRSVATSWRTTASGAISTVLASARRLGKYSVAWLTASIREQAGHNFKSSISHIFTRDSRNDPLMPSTGNYFLLSQVRLP